jgi:hypothetical protein
MITCSYLKSGIQQKKFSTVTWPDDEAAAATKEVLKSN